MKIIHIILGKANPKRMNGVNKVVYSLASIQLEQGFDVEVWGITPEIKSGASHEPPFPLRLFPAHTKAFKMSGELLTALQGIRPDTVMHMHGAFIPVFYTVSKVLKRKRIPFILTPHGAYNPIALKKSRLTKALYYAAFERRLLSRVTQIHLLGEKECGYTVSHVSEDKKLIIPNGQVIADDAKPFKIGGIPSTPVFGFMGRLDRSHKGLDLLLDGFEIYKKKLNGIGVLWLLGDGPDRSFLEDKASSLKLDSDLKFYGSQFGSEKLALLQKMHAFLHPSRYEGIPMAVLECALLGIPSIVSAATNIKPVVEKYNSGLGLEDIQPETIAKALKDMEQLIYSDQYLKMRDNSFAMVQEEFDWKKISLRFYDVYTRMIESVN